MQERTQRNERHETNDNPAPAPSPASHCSRGGSRVLTATSRDGEGRGGYTSERHVTNATGAECTKTNETTHPPPQYLPPRLRATARRVGNRCYGYDEGPECTKRNETNETTHPPLQHLPPRLRATARRVGNRCYGYEEGRTYGDERNEGRTNENERNEGRTNENGTEPHTPGPQPPSHVMRGRLFFR
jgi:hypothetical protein